MNSHTEIEVKILEIDPASARARLDELNAEPEFSGELHAIFFDDASGTIRAAGDALRLRREGGQAVVAFKKCLRKDTAKVMDERETVVGCFETMRQILRGLGYVEIAETRKWRDQFALRQTGARVVIDHYRDALAGIPPFVEIEASTEAAVHASAALLGFAGEDCLSWDTCDLADHYSVPFEGARKTLPPTSEKRPAVFFDRDGVVNRSPGDGYVTRWEDFVLTDGICEALTLCKRRGYLTVLVTSQRCVSKGLISLEALEGMHTAMQEALGEGAAFDSIQVFTGLPGSEHLEKPRPGLVLEAAEALNVDLTRSWLVGDADRDIVMAQRAGVPETVRVRARHPVGVDASRIVDSIVELVGVLEKYLPPV